MIPSVTVVPLGPGDPSLITVGSLEALKKSRRVILRTARHGCSAFLSSQGIVYESLDGLYDAADDFDRLHKSMAERVWQAAEKTPVCFAVPDPSQDGAVAALIAARPEKSRLHILPGVGIAQSCLSAAVQLPGLSGPALNSFQILPASCCSQIKIDPDNALLISELDSKVLAGEVKLFLSQTYPDEFKIIFLPPSEKAERKAITIPLWELDRQRRYDHTAAVFVPPCGLRDRTRYSLNDLLNIMEILCAPDGCPWDRVQTHQTLRKYLIEEAYEAVDAMDREDPDRLADELGDVLLQIAFHSEIGRRHGEFDMSDVTSHICAKMISRHAHIFGSVHCDTPEQVSASWEQIKKKEKRLNTQADVLADVCRALPALMRASKVQSKAAQTGFDWKELTDALNKVAEELSEVREELQAGRDPGGEIGDLLFACAGAARKAGKEPELLLAQATEKFIQRFASMEQKILNDGKKLQGLTSDEFIVYWNAAKTGE